MCAASRSSCPSQRLDPERSCGLWPAERPSLYRRLQATCWRLPTMTEFMRTSLFTASLRAGDAAAERVAFGSHKFWPASTKAALTHKAGLAGRDGADLGP